MKDLFKLACQNIQTRISSLDNIYFYPNGKSKGEMVYKVKVIHGSQDWCELNFEYSKDYSENAPVDIIMYEHLFEKAQEEFTRFTGVLFQTIEPDCDVYYTDKKTRMRECNGVNIPEWYNYRIMDTYELKSQDKKYIVVFNTEYYTVMNDNNRPVMKVISKVSVEILGKENPSNTEYSILPNIKPGTMFRHMYGYNMTINEFVQVTRRFDNKIWLKKVATEKDGYQSGYETPIKDAFLSNEEFEYTLDNKNLDYVTNENLIDLSNACIWIKLKGDSYLQYNGKPAYFNYID